MLKVKVKVNPKEIAKKVKGLYTQICSMLKESLTHAIKAGELLTQVHGTMTQKEFAAWCKNDCDLSYETAMNYIRCYRNRKKLSGKGLDYTSAIRALRKVRKPKKEVPIRVLSPWETVITERASQFHVKATVSDLAMFLESFAVKEQVLSLVADVAA